MIGVALLAALAPAAAAEATRVDAAVRHKQFESGAACLAALRAQHAEAAKGFAALPAAEQRTTRLGALQAKGKKRLAYAVQSEFAVVGSGRTMPNTMNHEYSCDGATLTYRSYVLVDTPLPPVQEAPKP